MVLELCLWNCPLSLATVNPINQVQIQWVTQSETNVSGFKIYRSDSELFESAICLNVFIPATNTSQMQVYQFVDEEVTSSGTYFYWLENLDLDGSSMMHGPVVVLFNVSGSGVPPIPVIPGVNSIYPNPFNPSTNIKYGVPSSGEVDLSIYNLKGQVVRTLVKESKSSGTYGAIWNGEDNHGDRVSSGIYIIKLSLGKQNWKSKLVLSK